MIKRKKELITERVENERQPDTGTTTRHYEKLIAAACDTLSGVEVTNLAGDKLGDISDIVIDMRNGCIAYAVLAYGGFLGASNKLFAIPWEALSIKDEENFISDSDRKFILNIPRQALKESDGFDKDNWPKEPDREWLAQIYSQYGLQPHRGRQRDIVE